MDSEFQDRIDYFHMLIVRHDLSTSSRFRKLDSKFGNSHVSLYRTYSTRLIQAHKLFESFTVQDTALGLTSPDPKVRTAFELFHKYKDSDLLQDDPIWGSFIMYQLSEWNTIQENFSVIDRRANVVIHTAMVDGIQSPFPLWIRSYVKFNNYYNYIVRQLRNGKRLKSKNVKRFVEYVKNREQL